MSLADNVPIGVVTGKLHEAWNRAAKWQWSLMGQTGRKIFVKMSTRPLARGPQSCQEVSPSMRLPGLTDALPLRPALLLCGCHGPALHAAHPAPGGQTQREPSAHLSALPHQALTPQQMSTPSSGPISCFLPSPPWAGLSPSPLSQVSTPPDPPHPLPQSLQAQMRGTGKGCPETERVPETPYHAHPEPGPALPAASPRLKSKGQAGPPFSAPKNGSVYPVTRASQAAQG